MNRTIAAILNTPLWLMAILISLLLAPHAAAQETVVLSNGEWPPYFSADFKHGGFGSRIVTEAFTLEGVTVRYDFLPWKRGLESARIGQYTGATGWRKSPEREKYFLYSDPLFTAQVVFFHKEGSRFDWKTLDDIGGMTIGGTLGYAYVDDLRKAVERGGGKLELAPTDEMNLQKLAAGRIDIFPCGKAVGYYLLRTKFTPGTADLVQHHPKPLLDSPLYLLFSKKNKGAHEMMERFNKGLRKLRESGRYDTFETESLRGDYLPDWDKQP
ncbi:transporter substrate-binding domain-containing protein [Pseudodesulfovibrio sp. zrk46]|uniref:substrate-binding periplasmic protein n=1 Tax=Pseudodesulfovibrio sp. zrk46 TaxID=2725288 RepID=UPI001448AF9D|nr:transporter substrate-binding domain-containing protein [Pseudodesulfovibrio sp. zrk46]QJB55565.1 amino acid ABC transporter substrate-binding protein [Pseudodesulfovibrio sp. zrk46]